LRWLIRKQGYWNGEIVKTEFTSLLKDLKEMWKNLSSFLQIHSEYPSNFITERKI